MQNDYPTEFRQHVLRRVAEKDDLDAVAREFGLPADLIFQWLKDSAESGQALGSRLPPARPSPSRASTPSGQPARAGKLDWRDVAPIYGSLFAPFLLLVAVGSVRPTVQAQWVCLPVSGAIGIGVFLWLVRGNDRRLEESSIDLPMARRLGIAAGFFVLSAMSTWLLALALPAIPHRLVSRPVEIRTTITDKFVERGKHISYCLVTPTFDPRIDPLRWYTDRATFDRARLGETIVLHGTTSWFGFMQGDFVLVPADPK